MQVRFEFRKTQSAKETSATTPGRLYVVLTIGTIYDQDTGLSKGIMYGPYATEIKTTKGTWAFRHSLRPSAEVRELNRQISAVQNSLESVHAYLCREIRLQQSEQVIDGQTVIETWKKLKSANPVTLIEVYQEFLDYKKSTIERDRRKRRKDQISEATYKTYPKWWILIHQFLHKTKQSQLLVLNVTYATATNLVEWMTKQHTSRGEKTKTYAPSSISKTVKLIKILLTYAQSKGYVKYNVLATFKVASGETADPKPLTREQMSHLETCDLPPTLRYQCDSWLVAAELCLHYADYTELPNIKFITNEAGKRFIQHDRAKQSGTKLIQTVNVTPRAARLLDKYGGPAGLYYGSNAYWSKILKRIARLADLRDENGELMPLQFGQGRDTGLTRRAVQGANTLVVTNVGGWSSPAIANRYIKDGVGIVNTFSSNISDQEDD